MARRMAKREERRESRKREIVSLAASHFLKYGFTDTNLDLIVKDCACSKATLYTYFGDKEGLFAAVVNQVISTKDAFSIDETLPLVEALESYAARALALMTATQTVELARLVIAEATRSPELAASFERATLRRHLQTLTEYLKARQAAGELARCDPRSAARDLAGLLAQTDPVPQLLGVNGSISVRDCRRRAAVAVAHFLKIYGVPGT